VADHRRTTDDTIEPDRELANQGRDGKPERLQDREIREVRATDIEPYTGLRYLSKLFRFMAIIMVLLLVAEVVTGIYTQGSASLPTLLGEASRLIVLAGVLWGTGDLALLLVDMGHDVRAGRILIARIAHAAKVPPLVPQRAVVESGSARPADVLVTPPPRSIADRADADGEGPPIP
jgi:hypothetical protein